MGGGFDEGIEEFFGEWRREGLSTIKRESDILYSKFFLNMCIFSSS